MFDSFSIPPADLLEQFCIHNEQLATRVRNRLVESEQEGTYIPTRPAEPAE
ncbi:MAG: hypothetical protein ACLFV7_05800 [Phycisphaerae bacterium]